MIANTHLVNVATFFLAMQRDLDRNFFQLQTRKTVDTSHVSMGCSPSFCFKSTVNS
jgi:hypothetical protein